MGIIYKLLPKVKNSILKEKQKNPRLSCRKAAVLIKKKFNLNLSKSSINNLLKKEGLSSPLGRTRKKQRKRKIAENEKLGIFLLKAADLYVGGSLAINEIIKKRLPRCDNIYLLQALLYAQLYDINLDSRVANIPSALGALVGKEIKLGDLLAYLNDLQSVKIISSDILNLISKFLRDVWFIRLTLPDNKVLYIDAEGRTVWSTPHIPYDFSSTIYRTRSYINYRLADDWLFVLSTAPGYDTPTKEFFDFLMLPTAFQSKTIKITLFANKMEELESFNISDYGKIYYLFALWPWQFAKYRKINLRGEFRPLNFEPAGLNAHFAEAEVELTQPKTNQIVKLRGCALKSSLDGKIKLIICTNLPSEVHTPESIAGLYLNSWPEPERAFNDFSQKIELFTYTASAHKIFSTEGLTSGIPPTEIREVLAYYLRCLDLFLRWHILPAGYEEMDFPAAQQRFYDLKARVKIDKDFQLVSFAPADGYPCHKELTYACQRLNEKNIFLPEGKRLWLNQV